MVTWSALATIFAVVLLIIGVLCGLVTAFANGMSDSPYSRVSQLPALVLIVVGLVLLIVARL